MTDQEVRRVLDALESLGSEGEPADRARRLGELLDRWPDEHAKVRAMRQQAVREMSEGGMSQRAIAAELGISHGRVRQILDGVTVNPKRRKARAPDEGDQAPE